MVFALAIIVTILGLIYILSPLDFIPDTIPILGWSDDLFVLAIIGVTWLFTLGIIIVQQLLPIIIIGGIIFGLIVLLKKTSKKTKKRK